MCFLLSCMIHTRIFCFFLGFFFCFLFFLFAFVLAFRFLISFVMNYLEGNFYMIANENCEHKQKVSTSFWNLEFSNDKASSRWCTNTLANQQTNTHSHTRRSYFWLKIHGANGIRQRARCLPAHICHPHPSLTSLTHIHLSLSAFFQSRST